MRISDFYAQYLRDQGVRYVFGLQGSGTMLQMFDSIAACEGIDYVCNLHEEAVGMAANGYAQTRNGLAVAMATAGPGATNLYTAVAGAWTNSVPVLFIVGNSPTKLQRKHDGLRFFGFHENDILQSFAPITKYVAQVNKKEDARYELEKAVHTALDGRPGPVMLSLPDDITWLEIEPDELEGYVLEQNDSIMCDKLPAYASEVVELIKHAKRPVFIPGLGIKHAHAEAEALELVRVLNIPVAPTWGIRDLLAGAEDLYTGSFGVQGTRSGNFAVQNADLLLVVGSRLDRSETGNDPKTFAREAKIIYVDIDKAELEKTDDYGIRADVKIHADAKCFLKILLESLKNDPIDMDHISPWRAQVQTWKHRYPLIREEHLEAGGVQPYAIVKALADLLPENCVMVTDASTPKNYIYQAMPLKKGQRIVSWLNFSCLGYSVPASIGAACASGEMIVGIMGDGGLQFNIQELATINYHKLDIKIIVFDNGGFANIKRLQTNYLKGGFSGTDRDSGLPLPDSAKIAAAYGLPVVQIYKNEELEEKLAQALSMEGPVFCNIHLSIEHYTNPMRIGNSPLEDMSPKLPRDEFYEQMIVDPIS